MRRAALALVLLLSVGCANLKIPPGAPGLPQGAELSAVGNATARLTIGPKMITTFDDDGDASELICEGSPPATGQQSEEPTGQQCISYEVTGGEFSAWQIFFSMITGAFTIYGAATQ